MNAGPSLLLTLLLLYPCAAGAQTEREEERVTLPTEDGWKLSGRYLKAADGAPTLVLIHTQKSDLTEWEPLFKPLKRYGFGYLTFDLRGHGNSFVTPSGSTATWRAFSVDGQDNDYNKMTRDVEGAIAYLSTHSVSGGNIVLVGSVLGANLAIKTAALHQEIPMVIAVSPAFNVNSVLSVNPLRAYGRRPILMIAGADRARQYEEFKILNHTAQIACGKNNVTVIVEAKGYGAGLITKYNLRRVLDWIKNPRLPEVVEVPAAAAEELPPGATQQTETPEENRGEMPAY
ncbi:MAG: hypothetical protein A2081_02090 [Elusimicrobia bacterium GWC2_61_19]|nr:MAG: hypothetical protein A2081_02090 [Elusimicrobia bacterium GWC2_61_19]